MLDGSQYSSSESIHCERCLQSRKANRQAQYYHQIIQATAFHNAVAGYVGLHIYKEQGNHTRHFFWDTGLTVSKDHVERIV